MPFFKSTILNILTNILLLILLLSSFLVFFLPKSLKYYFSLFLLIIFVTITSLWGYVTFFNNLNLTANSGYYFPGTISPALVLDKLSAFFLLVINITVLSGFLYAKGYLKNDNSGKSNLRFSIHYFSYLWLYFSMVMVVLLRDGFAFLVAWEMMSLSSFLLVIFDAEDRQVMKTGINYLIQMHVGMAFLLLAFLLTAGPGGEISFNTLVLYFSNHNNLPVFLLFFIGFGIKAGFIPLHTWLPQAHPAAPSHVSGVMSGVMIKMGIYGIFRILTSIQSGLLEIGIFILIISLLSGLYGVMMAILQHDLKRLLAYHSIENIGIIGIGIGLGTIGLATGNNNLVLLGLGGGMLHVLNHSLFKSLLFYNAGSVYQAAHSRNINQLGGLIKKMPYTSAFFLVGALSICGLPPFNGFISEYLIYFGMFKMVSAANLYQSILIISSITGLTLIGGLAVFCFTKVFGIVFLGQSRTGQAANAKEVSSIMLWPQILIIILIIGIGLDSVLLIKPVFQTISSLFRTGDNRIITAISFINLDKISLLGGLFIIVSVIILVYRYFHLKSKKVSYGPTWGCGYTAGNEKLQYTATSFADNYSVLANPFLPVKKETEALGEEEIFPSKRTFISHPADFFKNNLIDKPIQLFMDLLKKIAVMQTGQIQHYILYTFVFILLVFLLTFFKLI